jgi:hypothetical protein
MKEYYIIVKTIIEFLYKMDKILYFSYIFVGVAYHYIFCKKTGGQITRKIKICTKFSELKLVSN